MAGACPNDEALAAFAFRQGSAVHARGAIEAHLDTCAECRRLCAHLAAADLLAQGPTQSGARPGAGPPLGGPAAPHCRGAKINRYVVEHELGRGGMGVVLAAYDPELHRPVAMKLVRPEQNDPEGRARLLREARAMARVAHPNVVTVFDVGEGPDGQVFVAMELVDGMSLRATLHTPRPLAKTLDLFVQAAKGLAAAHAVGLVHRDFKPDNVLVGRDGRVRVTDFGLVRGLGDGGEAPLTLAKGTPLTATGALLGTPAYMAPEQHVGAPADARADQYAFGIALFEALVGVRPFPTASLAATSDAKLKEQRLPWPASSPVPAEIRAAVDRALARDPDKRHPSMNDLIAILERASRSLPADATAPSPAMTALAPPMTMTTATPITTAAPVVAAVPAAPTMASAPIAFAPPPAAYPPRLGTRPNAAMPTPVVARPQARPMSPAKIVLLTLVGGMVLTLMTFVRMQMMGDPPAPSSPSLGEPAPPVPAFAPVVASPSRSSTLPCPAGAKQKLEEHGHFLACVTPRGGFDGPVLWFHDNGKLREQNTYVNDKRHGREWELDEEGRVVMITDWASGKMHGMRMELHPNGRVRTYATYTNGVMDGKTKRWSSEGV